MCKNGKWFRENRCPFIVPINSCIHSLSKCIQGGNAVEGFRIVSGLYDRGHKKILNKEKEEVEHITAPTRKEESQGMQLWTRKE